MFAKWPRALFCATLFPHHHYHREFFLNHQHRLVSIITTGKITNFSPFASNDAGVDDQRGRREISVNFVLYKFTSYFILPNASDRHRRAINHSIYGNTYVMVTLHTSCTTNGAMNCVALGWGLRWGSKSTTTHQALAGKRVWNMTKNKFYFIHSSSHYNMLQFEETDRRLVRYVVRAGLAASDSFGWIRSASVKPS